MDEEALIARAKEERTKIFQRYDLGREQGAVIDPWEDPAFEVYHQTDRYGFIHDKRLPKKADPHETKAREIEMERVKKWLKMTSKWNHKETQNKLHKRVYKGIPDKLRSKVWYKLLDLDKVMSDNKNKYKEMLAVARQWSTEARQIDSDVNRQFREHIFYRERYSIKQKSLFNVLVAYSMYNMEVGYCQGMSGIAGVLLMYMDEEEAFWALSILLSDKKFAMHGLFIEGFPKLTRFLAHHDKIIGKFIPKLKKHFDQYNLDSILYSLKWFFVVFVERIPFSLCLRVWDIYLLDGEKVVTAMAYTILRLHKSKILKLKDMDLIVQYVQTKLHLDFGYDDDIVIKTLEQCMDELKRSNLHLPPPGERIEFPKNEFGKFTEPTFEAKVGRRKTEFTENEKGVTEGVKLRREITEQEIATLNESAAAAGGSNNQLNTVHIPESEDGGSLLGSSRKSLADTSVTSTADLSVLSGGQSQRSHQAFDFSYEDEKLRESDDGEGESSPGSAFCSMSVVARSPSPSALMMTPTPRAMSPQDIVRIYVPPAPPEETKKSKRDSLEQSNNSSYSVSNNSQNVKEDDDDTQTRRNSEIDLPQQYVSKYDHELLNYVNEYGTTSTTFNTNGRSTSSSRRGSMSRKSPAPMLDSEFIIECNHLKNRKYIPESNNVNSNNNSRNNSESNINKLTSFEELAKNKNNGEYVSVKSKSSRSNRMTKSEVYEQFDDSESGSGDKYDIYSSINSTKITQKHKSDYNIQYKNLSPGGSGRDYDIEYKSFKGRQNSSGNECSPFDYDLLPDSKTSNSAIKEYSRFFNNEDEDEDKLLNKSSDESSTSPPPTKSSMTTPINETIPLLSPITPNKYSISDMDKVSPSSIPIHASKLPHKKRISNDSFTLELSSSIRNNRNEMTKSPSNGINKASKIPVKSPTSPLSPTTTATPNNNNVYDFKSRKVGNLNTDTNKIRIKINQSQSYSSN